LNKILLLEDDPILSKTLVKYLSINGYSVDLARNGEEAIDLTYDNDYDIYLLDINVPLLNGIDLLQHLRDADDFTPAIFISAMVDVSSVSKAFVAGADDYIKKPFDPEELLIRIKAKTSTLKSMIKIKDYEIDLEKQEVFKGKKQLYMSEVQRNLFLKLVQYYPNPVDKDTLMECLEKPTDLALRVNISKLKKSLGIDIQSIRGVGYKII